MLPWGTCDSRVPGPEGTFSDSERAANILTNFETVTTAVHQSVTWVFGRCSRSAGWCVAGAAQALGRPARTRWWASAAQAGWHDGQYLRAGVAQPPLAAPRRRRGVLCGRRVGRRRFGAGWASFQTRERACHFTAVKWQHRAGGTYF